MNSSQELKVAIISSLTGGLGHYAAHLARPLSEHCFVKYITYPQIDLSGTMVKEITDSFVKHYIKWPRFDLDESRPGSIVEICDYLTERNINLVNLHIATTVKQKILYFTSFILFAKKKHNMKFVFTLHDVLPFDENKKTVELLEVFYPLADFFTVGNEDEKKKLMDIFHIPESKITIIHHGIYNLFDRNRYTPESARAYLDIPQNKKVILFFGWLRPYKGLNYLIQASELLSKKRNDFIVYLASGLKYTEKYEMTGYLEELNKHGVRDKFILNFNYLPSSDIEAVFKASTIVALPYLKTSQSGVLMAAMGFKRPVVITDVLSDKNWINKKAGFVVEPKDAEALAEKLDILFSDNSLMTDMGNYGFEYSSLHFGWKKIAEEYFKVYESLANAKPAK